MADTTDTGAGDAASYEELIRQARLIYRELQRYGLTRRQLQEAWEPVEAAISAGQAAPEAAREVRARWIPADDRLDVDEE